MAYNIQYFLDGQKIGSTPWADTLAKTKQVARDGLIRHKADMARIINDETGAEVDSVTRDVKRT